MRCGEQGKNAISYNVNYAYEFHSIHGAWGAYPMHFVHGAAHKTV